MSFTLERLRTLTDVELNYDFANQRLKVTANGLPTESFFGELVENLDGESVTRLHLQLATQRGKLEECLRLGQQAGFEIETTYNILGAQNTTVIDFGLESVDRNPKPENLTHLQRLLLSRQSIDSTLDSLQPKEARSDLRIITNLEKLNNGQLTTLATKMNCVFGGWTADELIKKTGHFIWSIAVDDQDQVVGSCYIDDLSQSGKVSSATGAVEVTEVWGDNGSGQVVVNNALNQVEIGVRNNGWNPLTVIAECNTLDTIMPKVAHRAGMTRLSGQPPQIISNSVHIKGHDGNQKLRDLALMVSHFGQR